MADVIIVCGGTGGHLSPGIAVAERLALKGIACRLVISRKQVDSRLCRKYTQLDFVRAPGAAFGWNPVAFVRFWFGFVSSFIWSLRFLRAERPKVVMAFGGFISVAPVLVGRMLGCQIVLHEANRVPGKAIRRLARFAHRLYLPEGVRTAGIAPGALRHYGYPLRREIKHIKKDVVRGREGIDRHAKVLVVIGGSQGASIFNDWVQRNAEMLAADGVDIRCITGLGKGSEGRVAFVSQDGRSVSVRYEPFTDHMADVLSSADLVISRAGAGAIAELICCLAPSILVPYPYAADNHQEVNAGYLEKQGGCVVVGQDKIDDLYREVTELIFNEWLLERLRANLRRLNRADYGDLIAADIARMVAVRGKQPIAPADVEHQQHA